MNNLPQRKVNGGNDEYFTKPRVAKKCISTLLKKVNGGGDGLFIEPSAGSGVFSNILLANDKQVLSYDINPQDDSVIKQDFLKLDFAQSKIAGAVVVGNPPFGTCSSLAIKFFNKSSEVANYIAFILPKTFRKESVQMRINNYFHLIHDEDLPKNSFLVDGLEHDVPTVFQIWEKQIIKRSYTPVKNDYIIWTAKEQAQFVIRRVGGNAGTVYTRNFAEFSESSNYFCVEKQKGVIGHLQQADFKYIVNNTAGVRSLSKSEILGFLHRRC